MHPPHPTRARRSVLLVFWNGREHRPRALVRIIGYLLTFILLTILLDRAAAVALAAMSQGQPGEPLLIGGITSLIAMLATLWVAGRTLDRRSIADFGFRFGPAWWADLGFGLALGALLMTVIFTVELALGWVAVSGTLRTAAEGRPFASTILASLALFISVGISEELLSRSSMLRNLAEGLCLPALGTRGALVLAWLISSAIFGALHAGNPNATPVSTVMVAIGGLFLGLGYVLTGQMAISIGLHITWNFFQSSVFGFPVSGNVGMPSIIAIEQRGPEAWTGGSFGPEAGLLGLLVILLGMLLIVLWVRARYGAVRLQAELAAYAPTPSVPAVSRR